MTWPPTSMRSPSTFTVVGKAAMHGIVAQEMRVGLDGTEIVDARRPAMSLRPDSDDGPQDQTADAAKSVDRHANCHDLPLILQDAEAPPRPRLRR